MAFADRPKRVPGHAFREIGDEGGLVVVSEASKVEVLNPVGSRIYALLDGTRTQAEIVKAIVDEFDVSESQARADLESFLEQLSSRSMLADSGNGA